LKAENGRWKWESGGGKVECGNWKWRVTNDERRTSSDEGKIDMGLSKLKILIDTLADLIMIKESKLGGFMLGVKARRGRPEPLNLISD
jgi:hypothetical protein